MNLISAEFHIQSWTSHISVGKKIMIMLAKTGYIEGVVFDQCMGDYSPHIEKLIAPVITLKGLEYLNDNTFMKKAANALKGIKDVIPGL